MLVLSRKKDQTIVIDDRITITIVHSGGNTVRLGIEAPPEVPVHRGEIQNRISAERARLQKKYAA